MLRAYGIIALGIIVFTLLCCLFYAIGFNNGRKKYDVTLNPRWFKTIYRKNCWQIEKYREKCWLNDVESSTIATSFSNWKTGEIGVPFNEIVWSK